MINNILETIKPEEIISFRLMSSKESAAPTVKFVLVDKEIDFPVTRGFEIYLMNNFLQSLNVMNPDEIQFNNYCEYGVIIYFCNSNLRFKNEIVKAVGEGFDLAGFTPSLIHETILDRLLKKRGFKKWDDAMRKRPLKDWVQEAISYLTKSARRKPA